MIYGYTITFLSVVIVPNPFFTFLLHASIIAAIIGIIGLIMVIIGGFTKEVKEKDNSKNKMKSKK